MPEPPEGVKPDAPERPNEVIVVEGVVRGHYENLAAQSLLANGIPSWTPHDLRQRRDELYHELHDTPIMPLGYCYDHDQPCQQGKTGKYGHKIEDGWCIDGEPAPEAH